MAQQVKTLAILAEDLGSVPSMYRELTTSCNSSPKGSDALSWPAQSLYEHGTL